VKFPDVVTCLPAIVTAYVPFAVAELQVPPPMVVCASMGAANRQGNRKSTAMRACFMRFVPPQ
jgi:hypothetical protein